MKITRRQLRRLISEEAKAIREGFPASELKLKKALKDEINGLDISDQKLETIGRLLGISVGRYVDAGSGDISYYLDTSDQQQEGVKRPVSSILTGMLIDVEQ